MRASPRNSSLSFSAAVSFEFLATIFVHVASDREGKAALNPGLLIALSTALCILMQRDVGILAKMFLKRAWRWAVCSFRTEAQLRTMVE